MSEDFNSRMGDRPFALARKASGAAAKRLRAAHAEEYQQILKEERDKLGIGDVNPKHVMTENAMLRKRIAELEAGKP